MSGKKKIFIIFSVLFLLCICLALVGVKTLKKFRAMYRNILDTITESSDRETDELSKRMNLKYDFDYSWMDDNPLVAHAFGGINGDVYTNSYEAFLNGYENGYRVFEVDFNLIDTEMSVVCNHESDFDDDSLEYTKENFLNKKVQDKYTSLCAEDVIKIMNEYPDIYIVTDTKETDRIDTMVIFTQLVKFASEYDICILDRIIPQVYNEENFWAVMDVYSWKSVILTLYAINWTPETVVDICDRTGIGCVACWSTDINEDIMQIWKIENGLKVAAYTENDEEKAKELFFQGTDFIYTDFLMPANFVKK